MCWVCWVGALCFVLCAMCFCVLCVLCGRVLSGAPCNLAAQLDRGRDGEGGLEGLGNLVGAAAAAAGVCWAQLITSCGHSWRCVALTPTAPCPCAPGTSAPRVPPITQAPAPIPPHLLEAGEVGWDVLEVEPRGACLLQ